MSARGRQSPKIQRWIDLLAALLKRRFPATFEELAREVPAYLDPAKKPDARMRMFERDKDELRTFGVPIRSELSSDGEAHGYRLASHDFYLPYVALVASGARTAPRRVDRYGYHALKTLAFEPDELAAVAAAADRVRQLADPGLAADAASAMRKLAFDLPVDATRGADEPTVEAADRAVDPRVFESLGDALLRRKTVTFDYLTMGRGTVARRTVDPYGLFFLGGHWYLTGHDHDRSALRNFRVSRVRDAAVNTARAQTADYAVPADFDLRAHAGARSTWELGAGPAVEAIVDFHPSSGAAVAAARLGEPVEGDDAAGAPVRRRFAVRRPDAFARWLLSLGSAAVPVAPASLVDELRRAAAATLVVYSERDA